MTIAACYFSAEGVVLGADSTSTMFVPGRGTQIGSQHHYQFAQKVFEFGEVGSTAGVAVWGLGSIGNTSWRTVIAEAADEARKRSPANLKEVAEVMASVFWDRYLIAFKDLIERVRDMEKKGAERTQKENGEFDYWLGLLSGGFCVGGRWGAGREPNAFEMFFDPLLTQPPSAIALNLGAAKFWGCPNLIERVLLAMDFPLFDRILQSGKWTGTQEELFNLVDEGALGQPFDLPLREAIDWIHASLYTTIKAMKFSHLAPVCGGPIEVAVITTDRPFRWVCHKHLGEALSADRTGEDGQCPLIR